LPLKTFNKEVDVRIQKIKQSINFHSVSDRDLKSAKRISFGQVETEKGASKRSKFNKIALLRTFRLNIKINKT